MAISRLATSNPASNTDILLYTGARTILTSVIATNKSNDTSPWFWWLNQPNPLATLVASITPMPAKKAYTNPVCTCCKVHSNTK